MIGSVFKRRDLVPIICNNQPVVAVRASNLPTI